MKRQALATKVLEKTSRYLKAGVIKEKPVWFDVVAATPPILDLTKKAKLFEDEKQKADPQTLLFHKDLETGRFKTRASSLDRKQQNNSVARITKLEYLEDELRDIFYHQHPWEFSRPKNLIENKGDEFSKCDWSHMLQFYKPLDGESVVQRTLWLLQDAKKKLKDLSLVEAYDDARFEFYRLRIAEEADSSISREESMMLGSVYESTNIEWGLAQEQENVDEWTRVASEQTKVKFANREGKGATAGSILETQQEGDSFWESATFEVEEVEGKK